MDSYHGAFPTVSDDVLDIAALVVVPLVLIAGGTARDGGKASGSAAADAKKAAEEAERLRKKADADKSEKARKAAARPKSGRESGGEGSG